MNVFRKFTADFKTNLFETLISTLKVIPTILNSFIEILKTSQNIFG